MAVLLSYIWHSSYEIWDILYDILEKRVIWVAVLPRVDQLTKVMPNFWRAVYIKKTHGKYMMASFGMETFSALVFLYEGNPPVIREILSQNWRRSCDVIVILDVVSFRSVQAKS